MALAGDDLRDSLCDWFARAHSYISVTLSSQYAFYLYHIFPPTTLAAFQNFNVSPVNMAETQANHVQYQKEHIGDNKTPTIVGVYVLGYVLAVTAVGVRFMSRKISKLPYWADDWIILTALVRLTLSGPKSDLETNVD